MPIKRFRLESVLYDLGLLIAFAIVIVGAGQFRRKMMPIGLVLIWYEPLGWPQYLVWGAIVLLVLSWFIANLKGYIFVSGIGLLLLVISWVVFVYGFPRNLVAIFFVSFSSIFFVVAFCLRIRLYFILPSFEPPPVINLSECRKCGYNLTGNTSGLCPECGHVISKEQRMMNEPDDDNSMPHKLWRP